MEIQDVNELAPNHGRTSCSDENLNGNQYFNEMGYVRCVRCAFLHRLREGEWPYGAEPDIGSLRMEMPAKQTLKGEA